MPQSIKDEIESKLNTFLKDEILISTNNISMNPKNGFIRVCFKRIIYFKRMIIELVINDEKKKADLTRPIDLSLTPKLKIASRLGM